ncbi:MAG: hypothetical protein P8P98_02200, partial [Emcibacteraceae bacterium]|nr:hypothetical protein [Emcibacteraceae bacterium]
MILRRFMKHVTDQNWFAVGLDVVVVIVGIFLGMQVQAWYEDQKERALENIYVNQLHSELLEVEREFLFFLAPRIEMRDKLIEVLEYFADRRDVSSLNNINCYSVFSSHIYNS